MPRTKVSKVSKRNREAAIREEKIRSFEAALESYINTLERKAQGMIDAVNTDTKMLLQSASNIVLEMKLTDFLALEMASFSDSIPEENLPTPPSKPVSFANTPSVSRMSSLKTSNPNDEGYLTADSSVNSLTSAISTLNAYSSIGSRFGQPQPNQQRGRTPGPFSSARARHPRRSRSACGGVDLAPPSVKAGLRAIPSASIAEHASRNKLRTPMCQRSKAISADRSSHIVNAKYASPPSAFMRWPKPGELVVSISGSPLVAQMVPDKFANVNIPVRNGVLSLRPKKLGELKQDLLQDIDAETLSQIRTLHENLNLIMTMAENGKQTK